MSNLKLNKLYYLLILGFTIVSGINSTYAESYVRSSYSSPPYFISPVSKNRELPIKFKTIITVPGLGNLKLRLTHVRNLPAATQQTFGTVTEHPVIALYRGVIKSKAGTFPVAAEAGLKNSERYLNLNFATLNNPEIFIQIQLNLDRKKALLSRKHHRETVSCGHTTQKIQTSSSRIISKSNRATNFQVIDLSLDADLAWQARFGDNANNKMLSLINATEVIYGRELGLLFNIKRANVYTNQSFGSNQALNKLDAFSSFIASASYYRRSDIYYLFTGESLQGGTAGIAYVSTICSPSFTPVGLSMYHNDQITSLVIAHEIGHIMGAEHDFEENCGDQHTIMTPVLSPPYPSTFSSCSKTAFADQLARYGNCLTEQVAEEPEAIKIITLSGSISKAGRIKLNLNLSEDLTNCSVSIKAAKSKRSIGAVTSLASFPINMGTLLIQRTLAISTSDLNKAGGKRPVYLQADLVCQEKSEASNIVKLAPGKINTSKQVTLKKWIKLFGKKLQSF